MKKDLCLFFVVGLLLLGACSTTPKVTQELGSKYTEEVNTIPGFGVEIVEGSVTKTSLKLILKNETDHNFMGNRDHFFVQKEVDGEWYWLKWPENTAVNLIGHLFQKGASHELEVSWNFFHGKLEPGHYRVVQEFTDDDAETLVICPLAAEFTIK